MSHEERMFKLLTYYAFYLPIFISLTFKHFSNVSCFENFDNFASNKPFTM